MQDVNKVAQAVYDDAADALKISKISMMMQKLTAFYTSILFSLKQNISEEVPTAAVDGKTLWVNPEWFTALTPNERITLLAHEVLHVALDHMHRRGNRDPKWWNIAADYVINGSLVKAGYTLPSGGLHDRAYDDMTTEAVYDIIMKKSNDQKATITDKCGSDTMNGSDVAYPENAPGDPVTQDEVTELVLRATTQAKAMGQDPGAIPGEVNIELQKTLNPPLPWHVILQNYMSEFSKDDYSFKRANRRFLPDYYMPSAHSEAIANIAVAVDTSGSVSSHEFNTFIAKISDIQHTMHPEKITVISFDTKVKNVQELKDGNDTFKELRFQGRGGTDVKDLHRLLDEMKPTVVIIFTDGDFRKVEPIDKNIPLIWLIHNNKTLNMDYGKTIHYDITV